MSDDGYMDLWRFLREIANEQCAEVEAYWLAVKNGDLYPAELNQARSEILREISEDPLMWREQSPADIRRLMRDRAVLNRLKWRAQVVRLVEHELPRLAKEKLATGDYQVAARRVADRARVELSPADVAVLTVDVQNKELLDGDRSCYREIAIRRRPPLPSSAPSEAMTGQAPLREKGAPGRPTAMHVIEAEMRRRADDGELKAGRNEEFDDLADWIRPVCARMEPPVRPPGVKTIARKLGTLYT
ncbi:MAG TPA: hypothetical protein VGQ90_14770, partial [Stellaceae bacterium]|nr:hypothetical protein [Stellaceae bacterium]